MLDNITVSNIIDALIGLGVLSIIGNWVLEKRRKIRFFTTRVKLSPDMEFNGFVDGNHPSDDRVSFECNVRFFSEKTRPVGLHFFQLEFCRKSYLPWPVVEFLPDMENVIRDKNPNISCLGTIELPSRKFLDLHLYYSIPRQSWHHIQTCNLVRLRCKDAEGKTRHFTIGPIQMPEMPPEGIRGSRLMDVRVEPIGSSVDCYMIVAYQLPRIGGFFGAGRVEPEQRKYWNGSSWTDMRDEGKMYRTTNAAKQDGCRLRIWNEVPAEWQKNESES